MAHARSPRDRRAEILDIAGPLFLEHGYQGASMSRIAAAVGGSKGTLYAYFSGKEELFAAYMTERLQALVLEAFSLPEDAGDPARVLALVGGRYLKLATDPSSVALLRLLYHEAPRFPEIGRLFHETCFRPGRRQLADYLARAHAAGLLRAPDPALAAEQFLALCQANLQMPLLLCVRPGVGRKEADAVVAAAVATFLAAHRPAP